VLTITSTSYYAALCMMHKRCPQYTWRPVYESLASYTHCQRAFWNSGWLRNRVSIAGRGKRFFSSPQCLPWLWGLPSLQQMIFTISEICFGIVRHDTVSKLSDIRLLPLKFWIKACTCSRNALVHRYCNQKNCNTCEKSLSCGLIEPNVWNECSDTIRQNFEWIHVLHFTNSSVRQVVCVKGKFPLLQNVWMELEYYMYYMYGLMCIELWVVHVLNYCKSLIKLWQL
jgi:hypothetical protein